MKGGLGNLMKQAQEVQANIQKAQESIGSIEINGESGAGMVKVVMNGRHEVRSIVIDPELLGEDKEMLEDLVAAAVNDAVHKVESAVRETMESATSGLSLPPGMKLPF